MADLQLHLALSNTSTTHNLGQNEEFSTKKKRTFHESFSDDHISSTSKRTLPLLIWDDSHNRYTSLSLSLSVSRFIFWIACNEIIRGNRCIDVEEDVMVGWPPVMRKLAEQHGRESTAANYITVQSGGGGGGGSNSSMYVKVEMEGIGIARKIDLSIHHCYQALTATLVAMFGKRKP